MPSPLRAVSSLHHFTPSDYGGFHVLGAFQHEDMAEAFSTEAPKGASKLRHLLANDVRAEIPLVPRAVALLTDLLREIQDDGDGEAMMLPGKVDQRFAGRCQ